MPHTGGVEESIGIVVFAVVGLAAVGALLSLRWRASAYEEIGRSALAEPEASQPPATNIEDEVRALVIARNERRARRGEAPLDVAAEVERELRELRGG
ncbi:MAG: hypothetical protein WBC33_09680 [Conexibacter sp.]